MRPRRFSFLTNSKENLDRKWVFITAGLFGLLPFLLHSRVVLSGYSYLTPDGLIFYMSEVPRVIHRLGQGFLPLWTADIFCGSPVLANPNFAPFDPVKLVFLLLPPVPAHHIGIFLIISIGILAVLFLGARARLDVPGRLLFLGAVLPELLGFAGVFDFKWGLVLSVTGLLTLEGFFVATEGRKAAWLILVAWGTSMLLFGHPAFCFSTGLGLAFFALLRVAGLPDRNRVLAQLSAAVLAVLGLTAFFLLPFNELRLLCSRNEVPANARLVGLAPESFIEWLFPGFFGGTTGQTWRILMPPFPLPIPVIAALPPAWSGLPRKQRIAWMSLFLFCLAVATADGSPWEFLARRIPGILLLRNPNYWTLLAVSALAWMIAAGTPKSLPAAELQCWSRRYGILAAVALVPSLLAGLWLATGPTSASTVDRVVEKIGLPPGNFDVSLHRAAAIDVAVHAVCLGSLMWALSFAALAIGSRRGRLRAFLVTLLWFSSIGGAIQRIPLILEFDVTDTIRSASAPLQTVAGNGRVWSNGEAVAGYYLGRTMRSPYILPDYARQKGIQLLPENEDRTFIEAKKTLQSLEPNLPLMAGIPLWNGYSSMIPARLVAFLTGDTQTRAVNLLPQPKIPWHRLPGLTAVIAAKPLERTDGLETALQEPGRVLYRVVNPIPRAVLAGRWLTLSDETSLLRSIVSDSSDPAPRFIAGSLPDCSSPRALLPVPVLFENPNAVGFMVETETAAPLVLYDLNYPGWVAEIDGLAERVIPADHAFRAVMVPPGKHTIVFYFRPESFRSGLIISFSTLLVMAAVLLSDSLRKRKK